MEFFGEFSSGEPWTYSGVWKHKHVYIFTLINLQVLSVLELDAFLMTHGPYTPVESLDAASGKRKACSTGKTDVAGASKRAKPPAYLLPDLGHIVNLCDERIPFAALAAQLSNRDILHHGVGVEAGATGLSIKLVSLPSVEGVPKAALAALNRRLVAITIRMQVKGTRTWIVEFIFHGSPLPSVAPTEQGSRLPIYTNYDVTTADEVVSWSILCF